MNIDLESIQSQRENPRGYTGGNPMLMPGLQRRKLVPLKTTRKWADYKESEREKKVTEESESTSSNSYAKPSPRLVRKGYERLGPIHVAGN